MLTKQCCEKSIKQSDALYFYFFLTLQYIFITLETRHRCNTIQDTEVLLDGTNG